MEADLQYFRKGAETKSFPTSQDVCRLSSRLLIFLDILYCKQYGSRLDCILIKVDNVCSCDKINLECI